MRKWVLAIVVVFSAAVLVSRGRTVIAELLFGTDYDRTGHIVRALVTLPIVTAVVVLASRFFDGRRLTDLGVSSLRSGWRPALFGMAMWCVPNLVGIAICVGTGWSEVTLRSSVIETIIFAAGLLALVLAYEAFPEELIFRGYLQQKLCDRLRSAVAVGAQALLFAMWGIASGAASSPERMLVFLAFGFAMGLLRAASRSTWTTIGFHLAFQTTAQLFGTVGDQFDVTNEHALQLIAFGILPFGVAFPLAIKRLRTQARRKLVLKRT
jgi:membrane protease YdiL (CAAX protease family)